MLTRTQPDVSHANALKSKLAGGSPSQARLEVGPSAFVKVSRYFVCGESTKEIGGEREALRRCLCRHRALTRRDTSGLFEGEGEEGPTLTANSTG